MTHTTTGSRVRVLRALAVAALLVAVGRARGFALGPRPWGVVELLGWGFVSTAAFDVWRPLGLLVVGYVLIALGNAQMKVRQQGAQR